MYYRFNQNINNIVIINGLKEANKNRDEIKIEV